MSNLDKFNDARESQLEKLFGELPAETDVVITLPSEGRFYDGNPKTVTITPIKFEDEKFLAANLKNKTNPINVLMSRCVKNLSIENLIIIDKLYILLKIREISYGESYPARITCGHCNADSEIKIDLTQLIVKEIPQDVSDPREITLPKLKKKAKVRFPRVSDEVYLNTQEQVYSNLWRFVVELDGISDPVFISKALPKMQIMDIKFIINNVMRQDLGLDPKFLFACGHCGEQTEMAVPINENFFSVT